MNVSIRIDYKSDSKITQSGTFPLRGRKPEQVALAFWKQIKKETSYRGILEKVLADGEDITELVRNLEKDEWRKIEDNFNLPF